jgi:hypothetical protein
VKPSFWQHPSGSRIKKVLRNDALNERARIAPGPDDSVPAQKALLGRRQDIGLLGVCRIGGVCLLCLLGKDEIVAPGGNLADA